MSSSQAPHRHAGDPPGAPVGVGVMTVSDTRDSTNDRSGDLAASLIEAAGHGVAARAIVPDDPPRVRDTILAWIAQPRVEAIVVSGGTGISARDRTYEAVVTLLDQRLDGFGELFRMLSWKQVGSKAMLSRALGGVARDRPVFVLPGSPRAVELGLSQLILPELEHLIHELGR